MGRHRAGLYFAFALFCLPAAQAEKAGDALSREFRSAITRIDAADRAMRSAEQKAAFGMMIAACQLVQDASVEYSLAAGDMMRLSSSIAAGWKRPEQLPPELGDLRPKMRLAEAGARHAAFLHQRECTDLDLHAH